MGLKIFSLTSILVWSLSAQALAPILTENFACPAAFALPALSLRSAQASDGPRLVEFVRARRLEMGLDPDHSADGRSTTSDLKDPSKAYSGDAGKLLWLESEGQIVGTVAYTRIDQETCEIKKVYVDPKMRGGGIGARLVQEAISNAKSQGYKTILLQTRPEMADAVKLYEKLGFVRDNGVSTESVFIYRLELEHGLNKEY